MLPTRSVGSQQGQANGKSAALGGASFFSMKLEELRLAIISGDAGVAGGWRSLAVAGAVGLVTGDRSNAGGGGDRWWRSLVGLDRAR